MLQRRKLQTLIMMLASGAAFIGSVYLYQSLPEEGSEPKTLVMLQRQFAADYAGVYLHPEPYYRGLVAGILPKDVSHMVLHLRYTSVGDIEIHDPERIHAFLLGLSRAVEFPPPPGGPHGDPGMRKDYLTIYLRDDPDENRIGKTIEVSFFGVYTANSFSPEFHAAVAYTRERWEREQKRNRSIFAPFRS